MTDETSASAQTAEQRARDALHPSCGHDDCRIQRNIDAYRDLVSARAKVEALENVKGNVSRGEPPDGHAMRFIQLDLSRELADLAALYEKGAGR